MAEINRQLLMRQIFLLDSHKRSVDVLTFNQIKLRQERNMQVDRLTSNELAYNPKYDAMFRNVDNRNRNQNCLIDTEPVHGNRGYHGPNLIFLSGLEECNEEQSGNQFS